MYKKIVNPGTDYSQQKIKNFDKAITKYSKLIKHPFRSVCQMDDEFYQTYRLQLFKSRLSPRKRNKEMNSERSSEVFKKKGKRKGNLKKIFRDIIVEKEVEDGA